MNNSKQALNVVRLYYRHMSQAATETVAPRFGALKKAQKNLQIDDGVPVYIKAGFGDKILYGTTVALTTVGLGLSLETFYRLVFKK